MKVHKGMGSNWLSSEEWSSLALWAQVMIWVFGILGIFAGVTTYWAKSNATFLRESAAKQAEEGERIARGPRVLSLAQQQAISTKAKDFDLKIIVVVLGDPESSSYAQQFIQAFASGGVPVQTISIGMLVRSGPPVSGLEVIDGTPDANRLFQILTEAGLKAQLSHHPLPVPGSVANNYLGYVGLIVGPKT